MKRSTWMAVLVTAGVLVVAGNVPRLPLSDLAASWRPAVQDRVGEWPRFERRSAVKVPMAHAEVQVPHSHLPRPRQRPLISVAPARLLATFELPVRAARGFRLPGLPPYATAPAAAAAGVVLFVLAALGFWLRRDRRGRVWQLAGRGLTLARIASAARIPQDAVRSLLTPGLGARR